MNDANWGGNVGATAAAMEVTWVVQFSSSPVISKAVSFVLHPGYLDVHVASALAAAWNKKDDNQHYPAVANGRTVSFAGNVVGMGFRTDNFAKLTAVPPEGGSVQVVDGLHVFRR